MSQNLPVNDFEWVIESDEEYFIEIVVQYPKKLHDLHNDLPFLPEKMKIEK